MSTHRRPARAITGALGACIACAAPAAATVLHDPPPLAPTPQPALAPEGLGPIFAAAAKAGPERVAHHRRHVARVAQLSAHGRAVVPAGAPARVRHLVRAANRIARTPYVWGGGHGSWSAAGYDCSGSVGYALHGAGVLGAPVTSGALASYGRPGPGRWVTIYANGGHVYMTVGGLRFDTSARDDSGSRWTRAMRPSAGYTVRHPAGL